MYMIDTVFVLHFMLTESMKTEKEKEIDGQALVQYRTVKQFPSYVNENIKERSKNPLTKAECKYLCIYLCLRKLSV